MREFEKGDLFTGLPEHPEKIKIHLEANATGTHEGTYIRPLSAEDVSTMQAELVDSVVERDRIAAEKKEAVQEFNEQLKDLNGEISRLGNLVKAGQELADGTLYEFKDLENGYMYTFDETGVCVESRKLKAAERQLEFKIPKHG